LRVAGIGVAAGLAGCSSSSDDSEEDEDEEEEDEDEDEEEEDPPEAPAVSVECDLSPENPSITHAGGDSLERTNIEVVNGSEGATLAEAENGTYAAGDTIAEGGIRDGTQIVWNNPVDDTSAVIAEC